MEVLLQGLSISDNVEQDDRKLFVDYGSTSEGKISTTNDTINEEKRP